MTEHSPIRRRDLEKTKTTILNAAIELFSEYGYAQTGLRDIAKRADVSLALPVKYFGSKAGLFEAALHRSLNLGHVEQVFHSDKKHFGKRIIRAIFDPELPVTLPAMISLSSGDAEAAAIAGQFAQTYLIDPLAKWLGPPKADSRAYLIVSICTGITVFNRNLLREKSPSKHSSAAKWLEDTVQQLVDGHTGV